MTKAPRAGAARRNPVNTRRAGTPLVSRGVTAAIPTGRDPDRPQAGAAESSPSAPRTALAILYPVSYRQTEVIGETEIAPGLTRL